MRNLKGRFFYRKIKFTVSKKGNDDFYFLDVLPDESNPVSVSLHRAVILMTDDNLDNLVNDFMDLVDDYIDEYTSKGNKYIE